jgi:hypothetical protein
MTREAEGILKEEEEREFRLGREVTEGDTSLIGCAPDLPELSGI